MGKQPKRYRTSRSRHISDADKYSTVGQEANNQLASGESDNNITPISDNYTDPPDLENEENQIDPDSESDAIEFDANAPQPLASTAFFPNGGGGLVVVATPIGNLEDVTLRALRALRQADIIACEDTRKTRLLLTRHGIVPRGLATIFEHNEMRMIPRLLAAIRQGSCIALVSNAGMPGISDPGYRFMRACIDESLAMTVLPGPSALNTALLLSGLSPAGMVFHGFLPRTSGRRATILRQAAESSLTQIFYESPKRLAAFIIESQEFFSSERQAAICREMTKRFEETLRGSLAELSQILSQQKGEIRGEIVVVIAGQARRHNDSRGSERLE